MIKRNSNQWVQNEQVKSADLNDTIQSVADGYIALPLGETVLANDAIALNTFYQANPVQLDNQVSNVLVNQVSNTKSITIANNNNRVLLVAIATPTSSDVSSTVTLNGVALTKIETQIGVNYGGGVAGCITLWRLTNPPVGTFNIVSTISSNSTHALLGSVYYNVDQTTPVETKTKTNTNTNSSITLATNTVNSASLVKTYVGIFNGYDGAPDLTTKSYSYGGNSYASASYLHATSGNYGVATYQSPVVQSSATEVTSRSALSSYLTCAIQISLRASDAPTSILVKANASSALTSQIVGFAKANTSAGQDVSLVTQGFITNMTGLTVGATYYLSNTSGLISTTAGTNMRKVGVALSSTTLKLETDLLMISLQGRSDHPTLDYVNTTSVVVNHGLGVVPKTIRLFTARSNAGGNNALCATIGTAKVDGSGTVISKYCTNDKFGFVVDEIGAIFGSNGQTQGVSISNITSTSFTLSLSGTGYSYITPGGLLRYAWEVSNY